MKVLLLGADYYGTLAAARCYGSHGVRVAMADESPRARGLYSRHVTEKLVHPPLSEPERLIDWLVSYGRKQPSTVLYATNDHLAWLYAAFRDRLAPVFQMFAPPESALITLLDKHRLHGACADVGIEVPKTVLAVPAGRGESQGELLRRLCLGVWPVLVKPRTQVLLQSGAKGIVAESEHDLRDALARFARLGSWGRILVERHPEIVLPMVQEYRPAAETNILSVAGFVGASGELVCRAATKVLQRPRKVGIGLCFEGRPVEASLAHKLALLFRRVGYFGCFEAEFIAEGDRRLLIDVNPRFYSQMAFEIARGLPLPMLVWHAARGDDFALHDELVRAGAWNSRGDEAYCHKTMLDLVLALQGLSGKLSRQDVERWRAWHTSRGASMTDAVRDDGDRVPTWFDTLHWMHHFAKHPRSFVRSYVLNR